MHRTAELLVRLGEVVAGIGGAGIVAVWAATFVQQVTILAGRGWTAAAVIGIGVLMMTIGTILQRRERSETQVADPDAREATGPIAVGGEGGSGGGPFGVGGDGGSATVTGDRGRAYGGRGGRGGFGGGQGVAAGTRPFIRGQ